MKKLFFILSLLLLSTISFYAQGRLSTKSGTITFEASVPSFEEVKATNENVSAILNTETGEFASLALVKGFRFKVALMEEHFNENYIESSIFPKAVFRGKILNFNMASVSEEIVEYIIDGTITFHGETKSILVTASLQLVDGKLILLTNFILYPVDFNIKIPAVVRNKIAGKINVKIKFSLSN